MKKKILIIGSGGREHALAWKLSQSPKVEKIFVAPGNAGTYNIAENVDIGVMEFEKLMQFVKDSSIDITVVGPDDPLAAGIVDEFKKAGLRIWGPNKAAANIEASKAFSKQLMKTESIPTAEFEVFTDFDKALGYVKQKGAPIVVKASGLALGKGVAVCHSLEEAESFLKQIFVDKVFGEAGKEVVIEEFLEGQEVSFHAFSDGKSYQLFPTAQDHKAVYDGDKGPNTGGMGTIAPVPWMSQALTDLVKDQVVGPTLKGLKNKNISFEGILYPGVIMTKNGAKVLEYNARFGDPETQSFMRLLKTDLLDILEASVDGKLSDIKIEWQPGFACCIVLASGGYPGSYEKGKVISGIEEAEKSQDVVVFHAGTKVADGKILTNGGRVLGITATGTTLREALNKAYNAVKLISFEGMQYRSDIGAKALTK
jgi:phosphoribosylamine--glycine ligase